MSLYKVVNHSGYPLHFQVHSSQNKSLHDQGWAALRDGQTQDVELNVRSDNYQTAFTKMHYLNLQFHNIYKQLMTVQWAEVTRIRKKCYNWLDRKGKTLKQYYFFLEVRLDNTCKMVVILSQARVTNFLTQPITLLDCDVEEPNAHLLLGLDFESETVVSIPSVEIDTAACTGCGQCANACRFNSIAMVREEALFFPDLCHACMGCVLACPVKCIREVPRRTGIFRTARGGGVHLVSGLLDVGQAMATGLIGQLRQETNPEHLAILDSPPGTSCPMLATVRDCNFIILVTEPTPFGLNDLQLAVVALGELSLPFGVVINRSDAPEDCVTRYCQAEGIELLATIPASREVAEHYSRGELPYGRVSSFTEAIDRLASQLTPQEVN